MTQATNSTTKSSKNTGKLDMKAASKPKGQQPASAPLRPSGFILPAFLVAGHLCYLYYTWVNVREKTNPFGECSWITPSVMTILYVTMIFGGPKLMENRDAFAPREAIVLYNFYQSGLNLWMVLNFVYNVVSLGVPVWAIGVNFDTSFNLLGFGVWAHYNNKYIEFLDSLFMVLRKKNAQLTFLHCWHHCIMPWAWYFVCKFACSGDAYFGAMCNSFIHVLMYYYYAQSVMGVRVWWKKYMTVMQLVQFCIVATHSLYILSYGNKYYPASLTLLQLAVMVNMFVMFSKFYKSSYKKHGSDGGPKDTKKEA